MGEYQNKKKIFFWIARLEILMKKSLLWTYKISDFKIKETVELFYEKEMQKAGGK